MLRSKAASQTQLGGSRSDGGNVRRLAAATTEEGLRPPHPLPVEARRQSFLGGTTGEVSGSGISVSTFTSGGSVLPSESGSGALVDPVPSKSLGFFLESPGAGAA